MNPDMEDFANVTLDPEESIPTKHRKAIYQVEDGIFHQNNEPLHIFDLFSGPSVETVGQDKEIKSYVEDRISHTAGDQLQTRSTPLSQAFGDMNEKPQHESLVKETCLEREGMMTVSESPKSSPAELGVVEISGANASTLKCQGLMLLSDIEMDANFMEFIDTAALSMDGIIAPEKTKSPHSYQSPSPVVRSQNLGETPKSIEVDETSNLGLFDDDGDVASQVVEETDMIESTFCTPKRSVPSKRIREKEALLTGQVNSNSSIHHLNSIAVERPVTINGDSSCRKRARKMNVDSFAQSNMSQMKRTPSEVEELTTSNKRRPRPSKTEYNHPSFSASGALDTFLQLRGSKLLAPKKRSDLELGQQPVQSLSRLTQNWNSMNDDSHSTLTQVPRTPLQEVDIDDPCPEIKDLDWPRSIVVNSTMLKSHRTLAKMLDDQADKSNPLTAIYREMRESTSRGSGEFPDIILNPRTCLLYTNIQALSQKSLPGKFAHRFDGLIYNRIERLAQQYDHVCVMVTVPTTTAGKFDVPIQVMNQFSGFCSRSVGSKVRPIWVMAQGDTRINNAKVYQWTRALITKYAYPVAPCGPGNTVRLLHDETLWELFLIRAGLNPMASQVVIGSLRRREDEQAWGLRKFVQMDGEQRTKMFGHVIGARAIERINVVIEGKWTKGGWET